MPASLQVFPAGGLQSQSLTHYLSPQAWPPLLCTFCTMSWALPYYQPPGPGAALLWWPPNLSSCLESQFGAALHMTPESYPVTAGAQKEGSTKSCPCEGTATHGVAVQMVSSLGKASAHNHRLSSPSSRSSLGTGFSLPLFVKGAPAGAQQIDAKWLRTLSLLSLEKSKMRVISLLPEERKWNRGCWAFLPPGIQWQDMWEWLTAVPGEVQNEHQETFLYQEHDQTPKQASSRGSGCPKPLGTLEQYL